ncbi:MAG: hypothetical protein ABIJ97_06490, partial [Bacteroidota bacterium]
MRIYLTILHSVILLTGSWGQPIPAKEENIPFLVTFGGQSDKSWGDDDFCQTIFFVIPENYKNPFYIRVFDP